MNEDVWENTQQELPVNDGGGLYDSVGLIDTLIVDCNELPRALFSGQNVRFCHLISQMVQKLAQLKEGVKTDLESRNRLIRELQDEIKTLRGEQ